MTRSQEQRAKELRYLQDALRNSTVEIEAYLRRIESALSRISKAVAEYVNTWEEDEPWP